MRILLVPKSMTLSDPWPGFQRHGRQNWQFSVFKREYLDNGSRHG